MLQDCIFKVENSEIFFWFSKIIKNVISWASVGPAPQFGLLRPYIRNLDLHSDESLEKIQTAYALFGLKEIHAAHRAEAEDKEVNLVEWVAYRMARLW